MPDRSAMRKLVVRIGYGFDDWMNRLIQSTRKENTGVLVLAELLAADFPPLDAEHPHAEDEHTGHSHHHVNPHYWLDPVWAQKAVQVLSTQLMDVYPEQALVIEERTQAYLQELQQLHEDYASTIALFPYRSYVGYHEAFRHVAERYGLNEAATIEPWVGKEPSVNHIKEIVQVLQNMENPVIYIEPQLSGKAAEVLSQETRAKVLYLDPLGSPDVSDRNTYLKMMRFNLESLKEGLSQR